jgi:hypothetical protein
MHVKCDGIVRQGRLNNGYWYNAPGSWRSELVSSPDRFTRLSEEIYAFVGTSDSVTGLITFYLYASKSLVS